MLKLYGYKACSSCRNAEKFLKEKDVAYDFIDITTMPPQAGELKAWKESSGTELKKFFNTSGEVYRSPGMKEKLAAASEAETYALLAKNGRLIKRPLITDGKRLTLGFKAETMEQWVD